MSKDTGCAENNSIIVSGEIASSILFSHEIYGEGFYSFELKSARLSGNADVLIITVSERILNCQNINIGDTVSIKGQIRSYNTIVNKKNRLALTIFAREIEVTDNEDCNVVCIDGFVCKAPVYRKTPFGREIADVLLAVNRSYNKSDYIPCIFWGRNAKYVGGLSTGDNIMVWGRMQSRQYQKKTDELVEERTAYEVSASRMERKKTNDESCT